MRTTGRKAGDRPAQPSAREEVISATIWSTTPHTCRGARSANRSGFRASAAFPIRQDGAVCGALTVYSAEAGFFRDKEIALLEEAATDISFALDNLEREAVRQQAEAALRVSEERYKALFDRSLDCVFLNDFTGNFLDANQAALDLLGYQREDIASLTFASLLTEDQLPLAFQVMEEIKTTGRQKHPAEFRLRGKDGRQVHVETQSSLIYREGKPYAIQGIARDITERKQAAQALAHERALLHTLVHHLPVSVFLKDAAGRITLTNPMNLKNFGLTSEAELLGKTDFDFFPTEQAAGFYADDQQVIKSGQPILNREEYLTKPDGTTVWLLTLKVPLFDAAGRATGLAGISLDITERKRVEEAHARLATAVEQAAETIVITDPNGAILYVNPAFEKTTGYTRAEALGQNPRILKSGKQDAEFYRQMWDVLRRG